MRNAEFVPLLMELTRASPGVTGVQTLADAGESRYPLGFTVTTASGESRWQAMQRLGDNETHDAPAPDINGRGAVWKDPGGRSGDAWLAAVIGRAQLPVIRDIVCWSRRPDGREGEEGVTVRFHNGARTFLRRIS